MAIIFALVAFVGWGVGDIFGGIVSRKIGGYSSAFWSYVFCLILASFYIPFAGNPFQHLTLQSSLILLVLTPIGMVPLITLYEGIKVGNASLVGTIGSSFAALVVVLSIIFLGDKINLRQVIAIVIIFTGLILSSLDLKTFNLKQLTTDKGVPYALISMVFWAIYFTFVRIPIREMGWFWPAYISWWGFPLVLIYMKFNKIELRFPKEKNIFIFSIIGASLLCAALFAFNIAVEKGQTAIVAPISGAYPILFASIAYFVFKDRLNKQQISGIIITLLGIILLSFLS